MAHAVHMTLGSSAAASLAHSGAATGEIVVLDDPLSCGPLRPIDDVSSWIEQRKAYRASLNWFDEEGDGSGEDDITIEVAKKDLYANPGVMASADEVVLWIGTNLADQIAAAWLSPFLRALGAPPQQRKIVQFQRVARGAEAIGVGMLNPKEVAAHPQPLALTSENLAELDAVWRALTAPDELVAYLRSVSMRFRHLTRALGEGLLRYPDAASGLNAWEARLLRNVRKAQPSCPRIIAQTLADGFEALRTGTGGRDQVGDGWLFSRILRLADPASREPALDVKGPRSAYRDCEVRLTPFGQRILDGKANFVDANGIDDWVFGVHLQSEADRVWFHRDGELVRR